MTGDMFKVGDICNWGSFDDKNHDDRLFKIISINKINYHYKYILSGIKSYYNKRIAEDCWELDHVYIKEKEFNKDLKDLINE